MSTVDEYLKKIDPTLRSEFERVRKIIKQVVPDAEETISYGILAFKYNGKYLLYLGAFKTHMSIFPGAPLALKDKLEGFKLSKGTVQFTVDNPLPESVIKEIIVNRLSSISENKEFM